jgi:hypothetical protein
MSKAK